MDDHLADQAQRDCLHSEHDQQPPEQERRPIEHGLAHETLCHQHEQDGDPEKEGERTRLP